MEILWKLAIVAFILYCLIGIVFGICSFLFSPQTGLFFWPPVLLTVAFFMGWLSRREARVAEQKLRWDAYWIVRHAFEERCVLRDRLTERRDELKESIAQTYTDFLRGAL